MIKRQILRPSYFFFKWQFNFIFGHTLTGRVDQVSPEGHFNLNYFMALCLASY